MRPQKKEARFRSILEADASGLDVGCCVNGGTDPQQVIFVEGNADFILNLQSPRMIQLGLLRHELTIWSPGGDLS